MSAYLVYQPPSNNYYSAYQTQAYPSSYNQYYESNRVASPQQQQWMMNQYGGGVVSDHHHNSQPSSSHYAQQEHSSDYNSFISIDYYNEEDLERDNTSQHSRASNYVATTSQQQANLARQRHNRQPSHDSSVMSTGSVASSVRSTRPQQTTAQIQQQQPQFVNNTRASPIAAYIPNQNYNNYNNNYQYTPTSNNNNNSYSNNNNYNYNTTNINYNSKTHNHLQQAIPQQTTHVQQTIPPLSFANAPNHITNQTYSSLETDSSVDICTVKDDHIWMIDNLVTIEEAEQLIDIYQDVSRRTQEALIQQQILQQQRRSAMSVKSMRRGTYSTYGDEMHLGTPSVISSSPHNTISDRIQHIDYTNEEFANFIFEQLKDVLPPDQSKLYGEKVGKTFELSGIYEKFTVYELRPGEKIEKSKGEDKCRIIEVESDNLNNKFTNEQYHEKSFLTCLICLKGVVDFNEPKQPGTNEQKLFGVNFYDMSKERPEHFIVLDHVGKSCLFSNNTQLFEVVENHGTENVYLLAVNVMYRSIITSPLRQGSSLTNQIEDRERSLSVSSTNSNLSDDNENITQYREILQQQQKKSTGGGKYLMWAFGTSFIVLTSFFLQTGIKVNKPIISKLLSILSKQLNI